jgi:hypothetical protein
MVAAWIHVALALLMLVGLAFDQRFVLGLNPWVKPLKFAVSIAIYLFTIALFISYLPSHGKMFSWVSFIIAATMLIEILLISMQAFRGTTSHFNSDTIFDGGVFALMGVAVALNTLMVAAVLWRFIAEPPELATSYIWGIRLGLVVFIIGSLQGFLIASRMAHTVGAPDGGPGLPFVNWSTEYGDLRVAHFVGLHGLQVIPLVGYVLAGGSAPSNRHTWSLVVVFGVAGLVMGVMAWTLVQALAGRPLIASS